MNDITLAYQMAVHGILKNGGDLRQIAFDTKKRFDLTNDEAKIVACAIIELFVEYDGKTITKVSNERLLDEYLKLLRMTPEQDGFMLVLISAPDKTLKIPTPPLIDTLRHEILRRMK